MEEKTLDTTILDIEGYPTITIRAPSWRIWNEYLLMAGSAAKNPNGAKSAELVTEFMLKLIKPCAVIEGITEDKEVEDFIEGLPMWVTNKIFNAAEEFAMQFHLAPDQKKILEGLNKPTS